jgi:Xaa-Pro aminopeptidase
VGNELEEKTGRLVDLLAREDLGGVVLYTQHNFAWLSGGGQNGVDQSRENGVATLLVADDGRRFIVANNIEMQRMLAEEVQANEFEPIEFPWQDEKASGDPVLKKAGEVLGKKNLGTDIPIRTGARLIERSIAACRYTLTEAEIERYRELGRDAGAALRNVIDRIAPGETETEIAEKMRQELALGGMSSVVTLVAADDRVKQFRHPVPTENRWRKILMIVTCAKRHGLIASLTRLVCVGDHELKKRIEAAAHINAKIHAATVPGETGAALYKVLADTYAQKGFANEIGLHHQGGATGYRTRDWVAYPQSTEIVQKNQAFAWNPSITGTKVEETCIVTADGIEIITASPDFPYISNIIDGREYLSPGIFSI